MRFRDWENVNTRMKGQSSEQGKEWEINPRGITGELACNFSLNGKCVL